MENRIEVSVIIATYYHEQYLERALLSVLNQNFDKKAEIIIADDCSKDDTLNIAERYRQQYPDVIRIITHEENVGTCKNFYEALMTARGRYILLMAGDDAFADDEKIKKQYSFLEKPENASYVAVCTQLKYVYPNGEDARYIFPNKEYWDTEITPEMFLHGSNYPDQGMMFRNIFTAEKAKEQFKLLYQFSRLTEDLTLNFFLFDYGRVYILSDVTYAFTWRRKEDKNQHNYNSMMSTVENMADQITILKHINEYYGGKYNLKKKYSPYIGTLVAATLKTMHLSNLKHLKGVPKSYILPACIDQVKRKWSTVKWKLRR